MRSGFTLIEVLITAFVLGAVTLALTGLSLVITRSALESERKTVALGIANSEMENARAYAFAQIEYTDAAPAGKIERAKMVERNNQAYQVDSLLTFVDDPLTKERQDFKQLTVKVSWPRARQGVVLSSFFTDSQKRQSGDICVPGTITCANPDGPPAPFRECPASGLCHDTLSTPGAGGGNSADGTEACQQNNDCAPGSFCQAGTCRRNWCKIIDSAPLIDIGACEGQLVSDCTATCPSYRLIGELDKVPICGRDAYCVVSKYSYERCPDEIFCAHERLTDPNIP